VVAQVGAANRVKRVCMSTIAIHEQALDALKPLAAHHSPFAVANLDRHPAQ